MCDYSLHGVASRPARIGDQLKTTRFRNSLTSGFAAIEDPMVAVCLLPGTELVFETEAQRQLGFMELILFRKERGNIGHKVGRFRQINMDNPATHHDAIEFPDGQVVLLTCLRTGQRATVLQLPKNAGAAPEPKIEPRRTSLAAA